MGNSPRQVSHFQLPLYKWKVCFGFFILEHFIWISHLQFEHGIPLLFFFSFLLHTLHIFEFPSVTILPSEYLLSFWLLRSDMILLFIDEKGKISWLQSWQRQLVIVLLLSEFERLTHFVWKLSWQWLQFIFAFLKVLKSHFLHVFLTHDWHFQCAEVFATWKVNSSSVNSVQFRWYQHKHLSQHILPIEFWWEVLSHLIQYLSTHVGHLQGLYGFFLCCLMIYLSSFVHCQW